MPNYLFWNNALFHYYFNESKAGQHVMLYADKEIIATVGREQLSLTGTNDDIFTDFINAVRADLRGSDFITRAVNIEDPTIGIVNREVLENFAYLILTVLAVTESQLEDSNSYYEMLVAFLNDYNLNPQNHQQVYFSATNTGLARLDVVWNRLER
jgi:hypothetical protein